MIGDKKFFQGGKTKLIFDNFAGELTLKYARLS